MHDPNWEDIKAQLWVLGWLGVATIVLVVLTGGC